MVVRAPKYDLPNANVTVRTHVHEAYWVPGHHSAENFDLLKRKHQETVPGATEAHVRVEHHSTETYPSRSQQFGKDTFRGATTSLPYEVAGENQPLMNVETDASDLHDTRALEWCAILSAGSDETHSTAGVGYWKELGGFAEYADRVEDSLKRKTERDYYRSLDDPYRSQRSESNVMPEVGKTESAT
ncbi:hypothetical protein V9T20_05875 [Halobacterium salinarum]|uniref:hypothetical protein n=1 Tax=Halobacterium salinarum TaxID=2242 RepID=UPI0030CBB24A